jgi:hypothetical protein
VLRPLAGHAGAQLVDRLSKAAQTYTQLGRAANGRSASRFDAARRNVDAADAAVTGAVELLAQGDTRSAPRSPATERVGRLASNRTGPPTVVVLLIAAISLLAIAIAVPRVRRRLISLVPGKAAVACTATDAVRPDRPGWAVDDDADPLPPRRASGSSSRHGAPAAPRAIRRAPFRPPPPAPPPHNEPMSGSVAGSSSPACAGLGRWDMSPPPRPVSAPTAVADLAFGPSIVAVPDRHELDAAGTATAPVPTQAEHSAGPA